MHLTPIRRAILTRRGPDDLGMWDSECPSPRNVFSFLVPPSLLLDSRWAMPIKVRIREANQVCTINELLMRSRWSMHQWQMEGILSNLW
jgi:hypothetical protein